MVLLIIIICTVIFAIWNSSDRNHANPQKSDNDKLYKEYKEDQRIIAFIFGPIAVIVILFLIGSIFDLSGKNSSGSYSNADNKITCKSCDRSFDRSSVDGKCIKRTNMCENCYNNYQIESEWLEYLDNLKSRIFYLPVVLFDESDKIKC